MQWLKEGDLNTTFFHKIANGRRIFNSISSLFINGTHSDSPEVIRRSIEQYFSSLFNKPRNPLANFDWDHLLPRKISNPSILEMVFTEDEVRKSVFSLPREKSPRPDGFPLCFFHHFWKDIKGDILQMFDHLFNSVHSSALSNINQTFIALIPKKSNAERIQDFRPISLLNSSYKIFSKSLAIRFSPY